MESDKIVCDNIQEELTNLLKSRKILSDNKIDGLQTRVKKLQAVVDASKDIAIEAEDKLNAAIRDREDTMAHMKIVQHKLDTKNEQTINQQQEYYEAGARVRKADIAVLTLNKELDNLVREAVQMKKVIKGLRDKIDLLEKSLKVHRENDTKRSTQLMELKRQIASKDEQIDQYRRQQAHLEDPLVKRCSDVELKQLEQLVNEVDDKIRLDSQVSRLSSYGESEMSFSHRRFRKEQFDEELCLSTRTNENENTKIT